MFKKDRRGAEKHYLTAMAISVSLFISAFLIALAFAPQVKAAIKKAKAELKSLAVRGDKVEQAVIAVGSVQKSILTEAQFQSLMGPGWVKMRGQDITGSKLCTQSSICALPNAEGRFLRDSVADANLGATINDTTSADGLTTVGTRALFKSATYSASNAGTRALFNNANYGIDEGAHVHSITHDHQGAEGSSSAIDTSEETHQHRTPTYNGDYPYGGVTTTLAKHTGGYGSGYTQSSYCEDKSHRHTLDLPSHSQNSGAASWSTGATFNTDSLDVSTYQNTHAHTTSFNTDSLDSSTYQDTHAHSISGSTETAPDYVVINTFIKIN